MIQIVVFSLIAIIAAILLAAIGRPDTFRIHRSKLIHAKPEDVFPLVNNFKRWKEWSPWENVDGDELQRDYSGPAEGLGARYSWVGKKTGVGNMEIHHSESPDMIGIKLIFEKPMAAHNDVEFTFIREDEGTLVNWTMRGTNSYMAKLMGMFMNFNKVVGGSFDQGLTNLKAVVEGKPRPS